MPLLVLFMILTASFHGWSFENDEQVARFFCEQVFAGKPFEYGKHFAEEFSVRVTKDEFLGLVEDTVEALGICTEAKIIAKNENNTNIRFISSTNNSVELNIVLNNKGIIIATDLTTEDLVIFLKEKVKTPVSIK